MLVLGLELAGNRGEIRILSSRIPRILFDFQRECAQPAVIEYSVPGNDISSMNELVL